MDPLDKSSKTSKKENDKGKTEVNEGYADERKGLAKANNPSRKYPEHNQPEVEKEGIRTNKKGYKDL